MRVGADEAVPDVEDGLDLRSEQVSGTAQRGEVILAQQQGRLQQLQLIEADGRAGTASVPRCSRGCRSRSWGPP